ncbi:unnamed protein product [Fusarium venenatum]|uniref:Uncharacterized protein n=1 Tax=Fusarium venenatum TaxID=56646 RepID=A0A2L2SQ37_9HYPO|nr:uncharacterized protein FVRRES_11482 [Fusarium venenatum]CEI38791.1 unnamed protein product [Fusarium venenatum]
MTSTSTTHLSISRISHRTSPLLDLALIVIMSRHHPDLVMCRKQAGIAIGRLCDKCDGKCPVCDSYVRPTTLVRICDECSFGNYQNKCVVCGGEGISDAFYCFECTRLEKDRDGCPKIINLGSSRTDVSNSNSFPANKMLTFVPPVILPKENESDNAILAELRPGLGRGLRCFVLGSTSSNLASWVFWAQIRL